MAYASKYYDPQKAHEYYMRTRELKGRAGTKRDQIKAKLEALVAKTNAKISGVKQQPLHKIPENASPTVRAFLEKQNRNISKKNNEAVSRVRKYASDTIGAARKSNAEERKRISGELKTALEKAREDYKVARENLAA